MGLYHSLGVTHALTHWWKIRCEVSHVIISHFYTSLNREQYRPESWTRTDDDALICSSCCGFDIIVQTVFVVQLSHYILIHVSNETTAAYVYHCQNLLRPGNQTVTHIPDDLLEKVRDRSLLWGPGLPKYAPQKRCMRQQKLAGVKTNRSQTTLPSILLSSVCSLENEHDHF